MKKDVLRSESSLKPTIETKPQLTGLHSFKQNLEKYYFGEITLRDYSNFNNQVNLVIELDCNYSLKEALSFLKDNTHVNGPLRFTSAFLWEYKKLCYKNNTTIDIEEFSIFFNDTSIIFKKIFENSISDNLKDVFKEILNQYLHFTKQNSDTPFEIYIPVLEKDKEYNNIELLAETDNSPTENDYYKFWGLYFDSHNDAIIYDLKRQSLFNAKLDLLE